MKQDKTRGGKRVEIVEYGGVEWRRYPDAREHHRKNYFGRRPMTNGIRRNELLHRQIWIDNFGPIPAGFHIHHRDENPNNNEPSNLEAVSRHDHAMIHLPHLALARVGRDRWKKTPEARKFFVEHGRRVWKTRVRIEKPCLHCGSLFVSKQSWAKFCSQRCQMAKRYHDGIEHESRICLNCGKTFICNRFKTTKGCSQSCGVKIGRQRKRSLSLISGCA